MSNKFDFDLWLWYRRFFGLGESLALMFCFGSTETIKFHLPVIILSKKSKFNWLKLLLNINFSILDIEGYYGNGLFTFIK